MEIAPGNPLSLTVVIQLQCSSCMSCWGADENQPFSVLPKNPIQSHHMSWAQHQVLGNGFKVKAAVMVGSWKKSICQSLKPERQVTEVRPGGAIILWSFFCYCSTGEEVLYLAVMKQGRLCLIIANVQGQCWERMGELNAAGKEFPDSVTNVALAMSLLHMSTPPPIPFGSLITSTQ